MEPTHADLLKSKMSEDSYRKLTALENEKLFNFIGEYVELCEPDSVYMCDDSDEDAEYVRQRSLEIGEESKLARDGQTIHYDGYGDQARDKANTKFMVSRETLGDMGNLNCVEYEEGIAEIRDIAKGIMKGKQVIVKLFCECPTMSPFSIGCAQITDSCYVAHSEDILYRRGYEHFMNMKDDEKDDFFRFCHSAGELDERGCSVNLDQRRIYQDLDHNIVYSMNAQYAGNSVGLKKHSMRLAIKKSGQEGWLCEHMFIMGCRNANTDRTTYFVGAYPSACGKTSTAMIPGETIVGDDIAYFRNIDGEFRAANVERGIFGIIRDVNAKDDPVIFNTLQMPREMIFSNVLTGPDNLPYWQGMDVETPKEGFNHSGEWFEGKKDQKGNEIPLSHGNARYTIRMQYLDNLDPAWNDRSGVPVGGVLYGGRDSDTSVPVEESFDWEDGVVMKACTLESETTSATLGQEGVRKPQPMANLDFVSYPLGRYIQNNLDFVKDMKAAPSIFATNYFLRDAEGNIATSKLAKKVWLHWAEKRVHGEVDVYETPTGRIPKYEDLKPLFESLIGETYTEEDYRYQFTFRCDAWMAKLNRAIDYYKANVPDCPQHVYDRWNAAIGRIEAAKAQYGAMIEPGAYKG
ncbi:phosphoenolpyruvate carboxykinase (GTP) [Kiritimatiella glycovorans]|uniref:Phosphoenolpyruvate carboxykinase [GTP] n=1 Tax=Kiritimatiella glycovorans TaxID=1307763 RepID=A0A0G3EKQ9_9BACT|nr:phosphoenolpyruvate carboxykinase (GTP) [Kiritimatiella glycovorans]AKJ64764.1 Phosphoenolpyruvate carboxykinase (GTP) [Kiritimatiella glycovorans]